MVHDELWAVAGAGAGYLCIACLEARLGRRLTARDFTSAPINRPDPWDTDRLASRKRGRPEEHPALVRIVRTLREWEASVMWLRFARTLRTWELERAGFRIPPYVPYGTAETS